jgi:hypothetical protein
MHAIYRGIYGNQGELQNEPALVELRHACRLPGHLRKRALPVKTFLNQMDLGFLDALNTIPSSDALFFGQN